MFDMQAMNANNATYSAAALPDVIDLGASFSNAVEPNLHYGVTLSAPATAEVTVTINASAAAAMSAPVAVGVVKIPIGEKYGHTVLGTIPGRYLGATATGTFSGKITAGLCFGVKSPLGVGL